MRASIENGNGNWAEAWSTVGGLYGKGRGITRRDGTVVDFAFAWPGADGLWHTLESAYDLEDEGENDVYVDPDLLDAVLGRPNGSDSVRDWYVSAFPSDDLGPEIDPDLTFRDAEAALALGGGFYDALGVGDSCVRERVFAEIATRNDLDYGDVYGYWEAERPLPAPGDAEVARAVAVHQIDNRFAVPSAHRDRESAIGRLADIVRSSEGDHAARVLSTLERFALETARGRTAFDVVAYDDGGPNGESWTAVISDTYLNGLADDGESHYMTFDSKAELDAYVEAFAAKRGLQIVDMDDLVDPDAPEGSLRAVLVPVGEPPREIRLAPDARGHHLDALQEAVGGRIAAFGVLEDDFDGSTLYVNDDGLAGCAPNRAIYATEKMAETGYLSQLDFETVVKPGDLYTVVHGDIVAVGFDRLTGDSVSLTDEQVEKVTSYFTDVSGPGSGASARSALVKELHDERVEEAVQALAAAIDWGALDGAPARGDDDGNRG